MKAELVVFDCDGVLVDSEVLYQRVDLQRIGAMGWPITAEEYRRTFTGLPTHEIFQTVASRLGVDHAPDLIDDLRAEYTAAIEDLQVVPGAVETALAVNVPCAVASNTRSAPLHRKLARCGFGDCFGDLVFSREDVTNPKPAPDIYLLAAQRAGIAPDRAIAVEDSANGVRAAVAASMHVVGFTGGSHQGPESGEDLIAAGAAETAASMPELSRILAARTAGESAELEEK